MADSKKSLAALKEQLATLIRLLPNAVSVPPLGMSPQSIDCDPNSLQARQLFAVMEARASVPYVLPCKNSNIITADHIYSCTSPGCFRAFKSSNGLSYHQRNSHTKPKPNQKVAPPVYPSWESVNVDALPNTRPQKIEAGTTVSLSSRLPYTDSAIFGQLPMSDTLNLLQCSNCLLRFSQTVWFDHPSWCRSRERKSISPKKNISPKKIPDIKCSDGLGKEIALPSNTKLLYVPVFSAKKKENLSNKTGCRSR